MFIQYEIYRVCYVLAYTLGGINYNYGVHVLQSQQMNGVRCRKPFTWLNYRNNLVSKMFVDKMGL